MTVSQRLAAWLKVPAREHWLSLLILTVPIFSAVWSTGQESTLLLLVLPVVALAVGYLLRPRHVWLVWLGSVVIQWVAMGVFGKYGEPGSDETTMSLILEAFAWMALGVLFPVWFGRLVRAGIEEGPRAELPGS